MKDTQEIRVVLIGGEKGGTGKSTIATNMAIMSKMMGHDVILIDTDKQASSFRFIEHRKEKNLSPVPFCTLLRGKYMHDELKDFASKYEIVIIDAGGEDSPELRSAMGSPVVQAIYSPFKPSEFDLETLSTMDELVYLSKSFNPNLQANLLFNQAPSHSKITVTKEAMDYCKDFENINVCDVVIFNRICFQYAASYSQSVVEFEAQQILKMPAYQAKKYKPKASLEMCALYSKIFKKEFSHEIINEYKTANILKEAV